MADRFKKVSSATFKRTGDVMADETINQDVPTDSLKYNKHNKSHSVRFTSYVGQVLPCTYIHMNAGDKLKGHLSNFAQFNPLNKPILDNIVTKMHAFFVPYRIVEPCWELWHTGGKDGEYTRNRLYIDLSNMVVADALKLAANIWSMAFQQSVITTYSKLIASTKDVDFCKRVLNFALGKGSLLDMFNLGIFEFVVSESNIALTSFPKVIPVAPLLSYQYIWNTFYRVENYMYDYFYEPSKLPIVNEIQPGNLVQPQAPFGYCLQHYHLYQGRLSPTYHNDFIVTDDELCMRLISNYTYKTSASPTSFTASFVGGMISWLLTSRPVPADRDYYTTILPQTQRGQLATLTSLVTTSVSPNYAPTITRNGKQYPLVIGADGGSVVLSTNDLSDGVRPLRTSITMDDIRQLSAATRFLEKNMLAGYTQYEQLLARFNIKNKSYLYDRPMYIGGLKCESVTEKVTSTSDTEGLTDGVRLGEFTGLASHFANGSIEVEAEDEGLVIVLCLTAPKTTYSQLQDRQHYYLFDKTLMFNPEYAFLTEQPLYTFETGRNEITLDRVKMLNGIVAPTDAEIIGYVPRNNEMRSIPSTVHGEYIPSIGTDEYFTCARSLAKELNPKSPIDMMYNSIDDPQCNRIFQVMQDASPSINMECGFGISVLSELPRVSTPMYL